MSAQTAKRGTQKGYTRGVQGVDRGSVLSRTGRGRRVRRTTTLPVGWPSQNDDKDVTSLSAAHICHRFWEICIRRIRSDAQIFKRRRFDGRPWADGPDAQSARPSRPGVPAASGRMSLVTPGGVLTSRILFWKLFLPCIRSTSESRPHARGTRCLCG